MIQRRDRYLKHLVRAAPVALSTYTSSKRYFDDGSYFQPNEAFANYGGIASHSNDPKMVILLDKVMEDWTAKGSQDDSGFQQRRLPLTWKRLGEQRLTLI